MNKKIELTVPCPCHENWDAMTPVQNGRFCQSCEKQVVDFTGMSDAQLLAFFRKPTTGSVCGRFSKYQLDRDLEMPKKRVPWFKYFFQIILPAMLMSSKAEAQGEPKVKGDTILVEPPRCKVGDLKPGNIVPPQVQAAELRGWVTDRKQQPLASATVMIKGSNRGVITDKQGGFRITLPDAGQPSILQISMVGYEVIDVSIDSSQTGKPLVIELDEIVSILAGELVIVEKPRKKNMPIPLIPQKDMDSIRHFFSIFPNPVASGSNLNIELKQQMKEGYYRLELVSATGGSVYRKEIWIDAEARVMDIEAPVLPAGNYVLNLIDRKSGRRFSEQLLITAR